MKRIVLISTLAATALLAACGQKADKSATAAVNTGSPAAGATEAMTGNSAAAIDKMTMSSSSAPAKSMTGTGEGKVVSVNASTGAITIEHGPIKEINWPAMTMGFTAKPDLLKGVAVGDKVAFTIKGSGENYEVTAIHKD